MALLFIAACTPPALPPPSLPTPSLSTPSLPTPSLSTPSLPTPAASAPVDDALPLPQLLAELSLADDATIIDVAVDAAAGRIYAADSARTLYAIDAATLTLVETRADAGGMLTLDATAGRLYAAAGLTYAPAPDDARVVVLDTATGTELARIPGRWISVDHTGNRLFVGDGLSYDTPADAPGIRILDATDFTSLGEIPQPGIPVFNPVRDELLIVAYTVYTADPTGQTVTGDLFPHLRDGIPFLFCNGCTWADWARVFPDDGLIAVNLQGHTAQGSGPIAPPTWLDAATLAPVDAAAAPELQAACGSGGALVGAVDGHVYRSRRYARYVVYNNLLVDAPDGTRVTWRDGIYADFVHAAVGQAYLSDGQVLTLPGLQPVGRWPGGCIFAADEDRGRLYTADGGLLRIMTTHGGAPAVLPPEAMPLPAAPILEILPSPDFVHDSTLLVRSSEGRLFRSVDGGLTWAHLRGGLPSHVDLTLGARFSPGFAQDRTLFAYGFRRDYWGEGVLRSTDGGDTWQPMWGDLQHLRVNDLTVTADPQGALTLLATAAYAPVVDGPSGASLQQSLDGGTTWQVIATAESGTGLPPENQMPELPVRAARFDQALEYRGDDGSWLPVAFALDPEERVRAIVAAPGVDAAPEAIYALTGLNLYRTLDRGATWEWWADLRLAGRTFADELSAIAVAPAAGATGHTLFVGTAAGEFWTLDPAAMPWMTTAATEPKPVATPAPVTTPIPPAATATATPTLADQAPPDGRFRPRGALGALWTADPGVQMLLGWALTPDAAPAVVVTQPFERGEMFWRSDTRTIYARFDAMGWQAFPDTFVDGEPADDPGLQPPDGLLQPVRGFGKVWREQPGVRELLGWAVAPEAGQDAAVHEFERGVALQLGDRTLVLGATLDGTRAWSRR